MNHECIQGQRITALEQQEAIMGVKVESLIEKIKELVGWIKLFIATVMGAGLGAFGYLLVKWVEK